MTPKEDERKKENKVWLVLVSDCESTSIICICSTKELAIKKMFAERDRLVSEWKDRVDSEENAEWKKMQENLYGPMIKALSHDDYENWDNYPHEVPSITEMDILEDSK